jgi:uncharacterized protein YndB with AHSA1/START domain
MSALRGQRGRDESDLEYTRIFDASRELIFTCMTEPEHLSHFWAPLGSSAPVERIRIDLRPGGTFETLIVSDADGSTYATSSVFLEVERPARLVWREAHTGMTVHVTLTSLPNGRTKLHLRQTNVPDVVRLPENQAGFRTTFDKLSGYLDQLSPWRTT